MDFPCYPSDRNFREIARDELLGIISSGKASDEAARNWTLEGGLEGFQRRRRRGEEVEDEESKCGVRLKEVADEKTSFYPESLSGALSGGMVHLIPTTVAVSTPVPSGGVRVTP